MTQELKFVIYKYLNDDNGHNTIHYYSETLDQFGTDYKKASVYDEKEVIKVRKRVGGSAQINIPYYEIPASD
jgi:hypothetical protein